MAVEATDAALTSDDVADPAMFSDELIDGRSSRWDDHRAVRRTELAHAARRAVHRLGAEASMDEIAADAGTSKSVLYRYFTDKSGLQGAVAELVVEQIRAALRAVAANAPSPREALAAMVETYLAMIEHSPHVYRFVTRGSPTLPFIDAVVAIVARTYVTATEADELESTAWASGAVGFIRGCGEWWLAAITSPSAPSRAALSLRLTTWLWEGPHAGHLTTTDHLTGEEK